MSDFYENESAWRAKVAADARDEACMTFAPGDPKLPRVLLIGDSISMGYTIPVREALRGVANVRRIPGNAGMTERGLANLEAWLGAGNWAAIHFNFGLHDLKYLSADGKLDLSGTQVCGVAAYELNLGTLAMRLLATGAKIVWASTTPVPEGASGRKAGDEVAYNAAAARVMQKAGIPVNDLHAAVRLELATYQLPRNVHFNDAGSKFLGARVAECLRRALRG